MKTFADKAKKIQRKYPNYLTVKMENDSMMEEMGVLAAEQEQFKKDNGIGQENQGYGNTFRAGGPTGGPSMFDYLNKLTDMPLVGEQDAELARIQADNAWLEDNVQQPSKYDTPWRSSNADAEDNIQADLAQVSEEYVSGVDDYSPKVGGRFSGAVRQTGDHLKKNSENYFNVLSGASAVTANLINRKAVKDPGLVTPERVNPISTTKYFDPTSLERGVGRDLSSSLYKLSESGSDTETYVQAMNRVGSASTAARGKITSEAQLFNSEIDKVKDAGINRGNEINTAAMNQALIDKATGKIHADAIRREYTAGVGSNLQGMFKDMADYSLSKKLSPYYEALATLKGNKVTTDGKD